MSISPPGDIILDVARAADPARLREAAQRLDPAKTAEAAGAFQASLAAAGKAVPAPGPATTPPVNPEGKDPTAAAYRDFEAMVLANLFEVAMPRDSELFGSGTAGGVWSSLFVQEIGKAVASRGGIGIADALARDGALVAGAVPGGRSVDMAAISARLAVGLLDDEADSDASIWGTP
jgi:hypothetical protein